MTSTIPHPVHCAFALLPDFPLSAVAICVDALTAANRRAATRDHPLYAWRFYAAPETRSWSGAAFAEIVDLAEMDDDAVPHFLFVCAGEGVYRSATPDLLRRLRWASRRRARLGAIGSGVWALAAAGLVNGCRLAVHWDYRAAVAEQFPHLNLTEALFEIDRDCITCAGAGAALDMMLALIAEDQGPVFAATLGEYLMSGPIRNPCDTPVLSLQARLGVRHPRLSAIIDQMEADLETSLRPSSLARRVGISTRHMERLFKRYLDSTPKRYHLELRLLRARRLLLQTNVPIIHVGLACGFESAAHFSRSYRSFFGYAPSRERGFATTATTATTPTR